MRLTGICCVLWVSLVAGIFGAAQAFEQVDFAQNQASPTWTITVPPEQKLRLEPETALIQINQFRASYGLPPLRLNPELMSSALSYADNLAAHDMISHQVSNGKNLADRLHENYYDPYRAAENLSGGQRNFDEAFAAWIASPRHRKNLLNPEWQEVGIAVTYRPNSAYRTFWVMILATPF